MFVGDKCSQNLTYIYEIWHNITHCSREQSKRRLTDCKTSVTKNPKGLSFAT